MFLTPRASTLRKNCTKPTLSVEVLETRRVLTAASAGTFEVRAAEVQAAEISGRSADGFTSYDFGLDTVIARDIAGAEANGLLPAVQKATAHTTDRVFADVA